MAEQAPQQAAIAEFYRKGQEFMARASEGKPKETVTFPTIKPGMVEWNHWAIYFLRSCGSLPAAMRDVERGTLASMTVPTLLPEWFDPGYLPPEHVPRREPRWSPDRRRPEERAAAHDRIVAQVAAEPEPSPKDENGLWRYPPKGVRIVGRFDKTTSHPGDDAA